VVTLSPAQAALLARGICAFVVLAGFIAQGVSTRDRRQQWRSRSRSQGGPRLLALLVFVGGYLIFGPPFNQSPSSFLADLTENIIVIGAAVLGLAWWMLWIRRRFPDAFAEMNRTGRLPDSVRREAWTGGWRAVFAVLAGILVASVVPVLAH